jgi:small GTP-binding protein
MGAFGVGKTSLVRRYVQSIFSDAYLTTVGVKIDKKNLNVGEMPVTLILWDIAGEDDVTAIRMSYLRGASGYFLVADGTRGETLDVASSIQTRAAAEVGSVPFVLLLNKADLLNDWDLVAQSVETLQNAGWTILRTSAKTGEGVEEAFQVLAGRMVK